MAERLANFDLGEPVAVPNDQRHPLVLDPIGDQLAAVDAAGDRIVFTERGWYEVLLAVHWDPTYQHGHRFAHTAIPDHHPLHSEAIDAAVLNARGWARAAPVRKQLVTGVCATHAARSSTHCRRSARW